MIRPRIRSTSAAAACSVSRPFSTSFAVAFSRDLAGALEPFALEQDGDAGGRDRLGELAAPAPTTAALNTNMARTLAIPFGGQLVGEALERALELAAELAPQPPLAAPAASGPWSRGRARP